MKKVLGEVPKILAPIDGVPFLTLVLRTWLGFSPGISVHLLLGHAAGLVLAEVNRCFPGDGRITASVEPRPLGVVGALRHASHQLSDTLLLTYGDVFPTTNPVLLSGAMTDGAEAVMLVCPRAETPEPPNCRVSEGRVLSYRKRNAAATHVDAGMLLLRRPIVENLPEDTVLSEQDLFPRLAASGRMLAVEQRWPSVHVGDPDAYATACQFLTRTTSAGRGLD